MTAAARFNAWRVVVVVTLVANVVYACKGSLLAASISTASLVAMLALLATTPANAIVLPRVRSEWIILAGFAFPAFAAGPNLLVPAIAFVAGILLAVCRRRSISAWWVAVVLWQPLLLRSIRDFV